MPILTKPEFQHSHGFTCGFEFIIKYKEKNKENSNLKFKGTDHHVFLNNAVGGYFNLDSTNSLYVHSQPGSRITWRTGFKLEVFAGLGYIRTYPNPNYLSSETKFVKNFDKNGKGHFMPSVATGLGWDFYRCWNIPIALNLRPGMYFQFPAEKAFKPYYIIEGSLSFSIYKIRERTYKQILIDTFSKKKERNMNKPMKKL
ncbi:MAG: hypothetical protein JXB49_35285 [Bacteroidales bacterium]|nr:hypothetical protein [Bacteroidales bacterium]